MGGYSEKKKESNKKYMDQLSRLSIWVTPEEKALLKEKALKENKSLNSYVRTTLGLKDTPLKRGEE